MNARELTLHIAVNLKRIARFAHEGAPDRVAQFLDETDEYVHQLADAPKGRDFVDTFEKFYAAFEHRKRDANRNADWAEDMATWGNILTHRAKLA